MEDIAKALVTRCGCSCGCTFDIIGATERHELCVLCKQGNHEKPKEQLRD